MTYLLELTSQIQELQREIVQIERLARENPGRAHVSLSLQSFQKRMRQLEAEFEAAAANSFLEVCRYRVFDGEQDSRKPKLKAIVEPISIFQQWFSVVYDALKSGQPKKNSRVAQDVSLRTTFGFEYSFAGSVGFVLSLPDDKMIVSTDIENAIDTVFEMAAIREPNKIHDYAERLGPAPIRLMYDWAKGNSENKTGVEINWIGGEKVRSSILVQLPQFEALRDLIGTVDDKGVEDTTRTGILVGFDMSDKRFHIRFGEKESVSGKVAETVINELSSTTQVKVPSLYKVRLTKKTTTSYVKEDDTVEWTLVELAEAS